MEEAAADYLQTKPLVDKTISSQRYSELSPWLDQYITYVASCYMIGPEAKDHPELTAMFLKFNTDVDLAMGLGTMLPSWLRWVAWFKINADYNEFRKILKPIVEQRREQIAQQRANPPKGMENLTNFMPFILDLIEDNDRASGKTPVTFQFQSHAVDRD